MALAPISATTTYSLYLTSAAPTPDGLAFHQVTAPGLQSLAVSPDQPLMLFNLRVSLEWDARKDTDFLTRLQGDLRRASTYLYDWSNGQVALGTLSIFHDKQHLSSRPHPHPCWPCRCSIPRPADYRCS